MINQKKIIFKIRWKYKNKAEQRLNIDNINPKDLINSKWGIVEYQEITADYLLDLELYIFVVLFSIDLGILFIILLWSIWYFCFLLFWYLFHFLRKYFTINSGWLLYIKL